MKIIVRDSDTNLNLTLPHRLLLNSLTATLAPRVLNRRTGAEENPSIPKITGKQLRMFIRELNRYRRSHKDWVLLEVENDASGEKVMIKL